MRRERRPFLLICYRCLLQYPAVGFPRAGDSAAWFMGVVQKTLLRQAQEREGHEYAK